MKNVDLKKKILGLVVRLSSKVSVEYNNFYST